MGRARQLNKYEIGAITGLCKAGQSNKLIHEVTGINLRSVQRWTKKFRDAGMDDIPLPLPRSGRPRITSPRVLNILRRQVDSNPHCTGAELKETNPQLLSHVSLRTVNRRLHEDLQYSYRCAWKKPIVTNRQKVNRVKSAHKMKDLTSRE